MSRELPGQRSRRGNEAKSDAVSTVARDEAVRWMNQGFDRSTEGAGEEAIAAYACAIALLRPLPLADHPDWANSLGAALMNHGMLLHREHGLARADEALRSFDEAATVLTAIPATVVPWVSRNLAGTFVNRANLLLDLRAGAVAEGVPAPHPPSRRVTPSITSIPAASTSEAPETHRALRDARAALALVAPAERTELIAADLALKARRVSCDALGQLLALASPAQQDVLATEAAEIVDDALALIRGWSATGETAFASLSVRFFRFGTELYRQHQPHFLVEFIEENLASAPACADELRAIAHLALEAALADGTAPAFLSLDDPVAERALRTRDELTTARTRLGRSGFAPRFPTTTEPSGRRSPPTRAIASRPPA